MPIYEYRCASCGHELEALQKFSDAPLIACPSCKADALVKKVSAAGFQLKGSGWYATDFKGGGSKPAPKADAGDGKSGATPAPDSPGSTSETKSGTTTESKSESKSDTKTESTSVAAGPAKGTGAPTAST